MSDEYQSCKTCGKDVKIPFWYCFTCNKKRKEQGVSTEKPTAKVETVYDAPKGYNSEGPEFGLACNLALRFTLDNNKYTEDTFESIYRKNVKFFHECNKELRKELCK